ncbi:MAG TPA: hypothetical protein VK957_19435 [Lunatimonas sp.]|nr:hypothetical protein [Lunatimonas sp.]
MRQIKKIHTDQKGRTYIKESFCVNGKMKVKKVYVLDGIPEEEFYENNASDIDHMRNGDYWLISTEKQTRYSCDKSNKKELNISDDKFEGLPF